MRSMLPKDWKEYKVGQLAKIDEDSLGNGTKANYKFNYISLSDVKNGVISEVLSTYHFSDAPSRARRRVKKNDILMATVRPNLEGFARIKHDIKDTVASTGFAVISPNIESDTEYIYQYLYSCKIRRQISALVLGSNYPAINSYDVKGLRLLAPTSMTERAHIAEFLSTWDTAIKKMEKLIEVKETLFSCLLAQMLSVHSQRTKQWQHPRICDIADRVQRKSDGDDYPILTISSSSGFVLQEEKYSRFMAGKSVENYTLLRRGEFAYNKGNSLRYQFGCIFQLQDYKEALVPHVYVCFKLRKDVDPRFLRYVFQADYLKEQLGAIVNSGVRNNGLLNIRPNDFMKVTVPSPPLDHQKKIANILDSAQKEIDLLKKQSAAYRKQKRGLMQKLLTGQWRVKVSDGGLQ